MSTPLDDPLTERQVTKLLVRDRYATHTVLANYTPSNWWECDLVMITSSGYWHEFEVKLTLADFRRDGEKTREAGPWGNRTLENKHDLLANNNDRGPTCFWYVMPAGLLQEDLLPAWAGLIEIEQNGKYLYEKTRVKAPRRHGQKADPAIRAHIFETCYWRFHRAGA